VGAKALSESSKLSLHFLRITVPLDQDQLLPYQFDDGKWRQDRRYGAHSGAGIGDFSPAPPGMFTFQNCAVAAADRSTQLQAGATPGHLHGTFN